MSYSFSYSREVPDWAKDEDGDWYIEGYHTVTVNVGPKSDANGDVTNYYYTGGSGSYSSYVKNNVNCRKAAYMLAHNPGRTDIENGYTNPVQVWWWNGGASIGHTCSNEKNTEPIPSFLKNSFQKASSKKSGQLNSLAADKLDGENTNNVAETKKNGQNNEGEISTTVNSTSLNASKNDNSLSGDANKYVEITKDPWIENLYEAEGDKSSYNDIIGPLKIDYEPTDEWLKEKKVGKAFYDNNVKTYLSGVTIVYKDGSYIEIKTEKPESDDFDTPISKRTIINPDGIKIKQNGKDFENPNEIERNMDFYVVNPYIDKEVKSIGIRIEKKVKVYIAKITEKVGDRAEAEEAKKRIEEDIHKKYGNDADVEFEELEGPQDLIIIATATDVDYAYNAIELPVKIKKGDIELTKKGIYKDSEDGEQKEEPLPNVKFKVYCNEIAKFVESVEPWDANVPDDEKSYRITFTEDIDKAKIYETQIDEDGTAKVLIQHLYAGKDTDVENTGGKYSYKLIEVDGGDNSYYIDPLKIESGVSTHSGEILDPDITTGHYSVDENTKYCTIENVTVYYDDEGGTKGLGRRIKTYILIEDDRTSADLLIEKVDETYPEEVKLEGAHFKVKLVKSEEYLDENGESDPDHNLGIENKWLKVIPKTKKLIGDEEKEVYDYSNLLHDDYLLEEEPEDYFETDSDGRIYILCVINGTYEMYEVKSSSGYDLTRQWEYEKEDSDHEEWADYGTTEISTDKNHFDNRLTNRKVVKIDGNIWEDIRDQLKDGSKYRSLNGDSVDKLIPEEVQVNLWVSETKLDNIIKSEARRLDPAFKNGLEIRDGFVKVAYTMSDIETGKWEINRLKQVGSTNTEKKREEDIYYWDLTDAYIEFVYNNETYVCVDPFAMIEDTKKDSLEIRQESVPKNSKAIEYELDKDELNDMKLTGVSGEKPGSAVTKQKATWGNGNSETMSPTDILNFNWDTLNEGDTDYKYDLDELGLTGYYNPDRYYVENINLGLWRKHEPEYLVQQTLEYSKILMNGYTYTYDYVHGTNGLLASNMVPATYQQEGWKVYGAKVYPSDIAYTAKNGVTENKGMRMFVVYKIDIINPEVPTDIDDNIYDEVRLYVTKLTNTFNSKKYTVSAEHTKDTNWEGSQYFGLWDTQEDQENFATANYRIKDDEKEVDAGYDQLSNGILPANENNSRVESVYIQFEVNKPFLEAILSGNLEEYDDRVAISQAHTVAHHAYTREDNTWKDYDEVSAEESYYENSEDGTEASRESDESQASVARKTNREEDNNEKRHTFLHRSKDVPNDAGSLGVLFTLGEQRTISGTVFEDLDESGDEENKGNGILEEKETNRGQKVKVELIDAETNTNALLYQSNSEPEEAVTETDDEGKYEFAGVVPGVYKLRFTYSDPDGKTVMKDTNPLTSNDYKSTIINTEENYAGDFIRNANEATQDDIMEATRRYKEAILSKNYAAEIEDGSDMMRDRNLTEWYKQIYNKPDAPKYNVSTDNFDIRAEMETHIYSEEESQGSYKPLMESYTPFFSISVENDIQDKRPVDTYAYEGEDEKYYNLGHRYWYDGFNLGVIKTTETNITLDKVISDVKLTTSSGTTLVQGSPREALNYVTALDEIQDGSKYVRVELPIDNIYGTALETTYKITIKDNLNNAKNNKDYIEDEGNEFYGYYFKYGDRKGNPHLVQTKVNEVIDEMDSDYDLLNNTLAEKTYHPFEAEGVENEDGENKETPVTVTAEESRLVLTEWEPLEVGGYTIVEYTASGIFRDDMDLNYNNNARITKIQLDKCQALRTECKSWRDPIDTRLVVTPDTGEDRSSTYYVIGIMSLLILGAGIVIIKGIVSKKQD